MKRTILSLLILGSLAEAQAETLAAWNFNGTATTAGSHYSPTNARTQHANLTGTVQLSTNSGVNLGTLATNSWSVRNVTETSLANAIAADDYIALTLTPQNGYQITITNVQIKAYRGGTASINVALFSAAGGFSAGNEIGTGTITGNASGSANTLTLAVNIPNRSAATTFRIYMYGSSGANIPLHYYSSSSSSDAVTVQGTVASALPPVSSTTMIIH